MAEMIMVTKKEGNEVSSNAFTTKMFVDSLLEEGVATLMTLESREDFEKSLKTSDIISIGHIDCAQEFGVEAERGTVHLVPGDIIHICEANQEGGGRLEIGVTELSQMKGLFFRFIKIEIIERIVIDKGREYFDKIGAEIEAWEQAELEEMNL